jgi:hypothetical protein
MPRRLKPHVALCRLDGVSLVGNKTPRSELFTYNLDRGIWVFDIQKFVGRVDIAP